MRENTVLRFANATKAIHSREGYKSYMSRPHMDPYPDPSTVYRRNGGRLPSTLELLCLQLESPDPHSRGRDLVHHIKAQHLQVNIEGSFSVVGVLSSMSVSNRLYAFQFIWKVIHR